MRGRAPKPASSLEALVHAQPTALSDPEAPTLVQIAATTYVEGIAARAVVTSSSVSSNATSSGTSTSRRLASSTSSSASASSTMIHTKTPVAVIAGALAGFIVLMAICLSVAIVKHRKRRDTLRLIRAPMEMDSAGSPLDKHPFPPQLHHTLSDRHSHDRPRSHRHSRPHSHNHDRHAHGTGSRSSTAGTAKHQSSYASSSSGSNSHSHGTSSTGSEAGRKTKRKRYPPLVDPNSVAVGGKSQLSQQQLAQLQHQHRLESSPEEQDVSVGVPRIVVTGEEGQEGSVRSGGSESAVSGRRSADDQSFVSGGSTLVGGVPAQMNKAGSLSIRTAESGLSGSGPPSPSLDDRRPSIESSSLGTVAGSRTSSPQPAVGYPPQQYSPQAYLPQAYSPKTYRPPQQLHPPQQLYPPQTYPPQPYASQPYAGDVPYPPRSSSSQSSSAPISSAQLLPPTASSSSHLHPSPTALSIPLPQSLSPNTLALPSPPAQHTTQSASSVAELQAQIAALRRENEELRLVGIDPSVRVGVDAPPAYDDVGVGVGARRGPGR